MRSTLIRTFLENRETYQLIDRLPCVPSRSFATVSVFDAISTARPLAIHPSIRNVLSRFNGRGRLAVTQRRQQTTVFRYNA